MLKVLSVLILSLFLFGCTTTNTPRLVTQELRVVTVPEELFDCPDVGRLPSPDTLTDRQVSTLIINLGRAYRRCADSNNAIKAYIEEAKKQLEGSQE